MATQRLVNTNFWKDTYIIDLDPTQKLLFLYFLTNPRTSLAGVYEISLREVAFDTGIDRDMVEKILNKFCADGKMYYAKGWLVLRNFVKHQRVNPSIQKGIDRAITELPDWLQKIVQEHSAIFDQQALILQTGDSLGTDSTQSEPTKPNLTKPNLTKKTTNVVGDNAPEHVNKSDPAINGLFDYWRKTVGYEIKGKIQANRRACSNLLRKYGELDMRKLISIAAAASNERYAPSIADFCQLQSDVNRLIMWAKKKSTNPEVVVL
jgi:hypothetical protein